MPLRLLKISSLVLCAILLAGCKASAVHAKPQSINRIRVQSLRQGINFYRRATWHWQKLALATPTPSEYLDKRTNSEPVLRWSAKLWQQRAAQARYNAQHPPHLKMWLCIHGQEASWTDDASNNPHWGGMQMSEWFMQTYAPRLLASEGKANHWPALQQVWVTERAYKKEDLSKQWLLGQWPGTAPSCI